ncbi:MAG: 30S ribosome-binding factor RbfA [Arcanobacterium sp.]|nr:30S ribosome-binding factor RbfA [Arcanobacterium sp.]MDY5589043.1 30S ribosome-binding factor RbfA [Arcanobacterium sp.]
MPNTRQARVAEQIQQIVARVIHTKLKDPRLGMVTVTDVRVTGDLQHATVFYTVFSEQDAARTARALESAKGLIRSTVGKSIGLRLTPTIEFEVDHVPEQSRTIEDALAAARAHDAEVRRLAEGADFAGAADPYKKPHVAESLAPVATSEYAENAVDDAAA